MLAVDLAAIIMALIMIFHIKRKYTAVGRTLGARVANICSILGRKEMVIFFYLYLGCVLLELLLMSNIIPLSGKMYKYFAAAHIATITAAFAILLCNGFVGFQWAEDGTIASVWVRLLPEN